MSEVTVSIPGQRPIDMFARQENRRARNQEVEILLVDDQDDLRRLLAQTLRSAGYLITEAACGEHALETLPLQAARIRLLITDVMMPGINGCELARQVQRNYPHIRILFISGYAAGLLEPGAAFLQKPFSPKEFLQATKKALAGASKAEAYRASSGSAPA
jgi:two-component system, cell cycle sensor histidine kinase and response regulator CckA